MIEDEKESIAASGRSAIKSLTHSAGARDGLIMVSAIFIAGAFDYLTNVMVGRILVPAEFGVFIAVAALLQVMVYLTNVIRNVVAYYTAELMAQQDSFLQITAFLQNRWRWAWRWGLLATLLLFLAAPLVAQFLKMDSAVPIWAGSLLLLLLFLRPVTDGALQGIQQFIKLGSVQIIQAILRFGLAIIFLMLGWQAAGAIFALPLASAVTLLVARWYLRSYFRARPGSLSTQAVSGQYSTRTLVGFLAFALLINIDVLVVKRFFEPDVAGNYGPVVTLGKINLFLAMSTGLVLFPKVVQRRATGRPGTSILLAALLVTLTPGFVITFLYLLFPGLIVQTVFSDAYRDPGILLGLIGLATTLFAGVYVWLNYALSLDDPKFVYALLAIVLLQAIGLVVFNDTLTSIASVLVVSGLLGNGVGLFTSLRRT